MSVAAREWHLARRPGARASTEDFVLAETAVPAPGPGQVVVRNTHLSVDPYLRGRMDDRPSYIVPFPLNAPLDGAAVGVVVETRAEGVPVGQVVEHFAGLREVTVADHLHRMPAFRAEMIPWLRAGRIVHHQTVSDGIERVPDALLGLLRSGTATTGKVIVRLEGAR
ncbi:hypothetical protein AB0J72_08155 [Dactylosporangium sp. NPDC049742]|uniref:hypothetical protein n=1 Tax=Dactylosporangium sp. NPDC049742 TaxID=3154737 RepID=UPI0034120CC6